MLASSDHVLPCRWSTHAKLWVFLFLYVVYNLRTSIDTSNQLLMASTKFRRTPSYFFIKRLAPELRWVSTKGDQILGESGIGNPAIFPRREIAALAGLTISFCLLG
ncbi:hypothetical protein K450DRAFT_225768 [Umbelopsis ramanniana AG]|uniref:Uncharacterized protein n=1 Tax=Umbelopsis ramanniana AG TaxID=1314678 RepID=A0AAD5EHF7_UMBRA|nr:uncharacterized protein K450DRAFT_225768 [Umbelopsis ramanniana AG]KAI8582986.1 hypothetical protein K450DRAFT_225768 [Umbelopsis ramanniana AG]